MKIRLLLICSLLFISSSFASYYMLGMRNSKYAYAAYENTRHWGVALENSIFVEEVELQYARAAAFYTFYLNFGLEGAYTLYYGRRYNGVFYDVGAMLTLNYNIVGRLLQIGGTFQPFYDSDLKSRNAYNAWVQAIPLDEVGLFLGIKNQAEYRDLERRAYVGVVFDLPHIVLKPEVSTPLEKGCKSTTRITVNFIYRNSL